MSDVPAKEKEIEKEKRSRSWKKIWNRKIRA